MPNTSEQTITQFVETEFKDFSVENTRRMVPSVVDGLKRSQRKAVWAMSQMKGLETVERVGLKAAAMTAYKHGGNNMCGTVINMAKDFPGTNNVPLIRKEGQFGSFIDHDNSSARYIEAEIHDNYRAFFKTEDDDILSHQYDQGKKIEPYYLYPIIPIVLVNGARAVGSGYGTKFPGHKVNDVLVAVLETLSLGRPQSKLVPGYNNYVGDVIRKESEQVEIRGKLEIKNTTTVLITGIIPNYDQETFKTKQLIPKLNAKEIVDYIDDSNETDGWNITIKYTREALSAHTEESLLESFGLINRDTPNYTLWDFEGKIKKYDCPEDIVVEFVEWRLARNEERRQSMLSKLQSEIDYWTQYLWFLKDYFDNTDTYKTCNKQQMLDRLLGLGIYDEHADKFIKTPAYKLNAEGITKAEESIGKLKAEYQILQDKTPKSIYLDDLEQLGQYIEEQNNVA